LGREAKSYDDDDEPFSVPFRKSADALGTDAEPLDRAKNRKANQRDKKELRRGIKKMLTSASPTDGSFWIRTWLFGFLWL
jgi:hypothetical protein